MKEKHGKYTFLPLRIALGLFFISSGVPKLMDLVAGEGNVVGYFSSLGILFPEAMAWIVMLIEIVGGLFLVIGLFTWWSSFLIGTVMLVAAIITGLIAQFDIAGLIEHIMYVAALATIMMSKDTTLAVDEKIGWIEAKF